MWSIKQFNFGKRSGSVSGRLSTLKQICACATWHCSRLYYFHCIRRLCKKFAVSRCCICCFFVVSSYPWTYYWIHYWKLKLCTCSAVVFLKYIFLYMCCWQDLKYVPNLCMSLNLSGSVTVFIFYFITKQYTEHTQGKVHIRSTHFGCFLKKFFN